MLITLLMFWLRLQKQSAMHRPSRQKPRGKKIIVLNCTNKMVYLKSVDQKDLDSSEIFLLKDIVYMFLKMSSRPRFRQGRTQRQETNPQINPLMKESIIEVVDHVAYRLATNDAKES